MDASRPASVVFGVRHGEVSCGNVSGLACSHMAAGLDEIRGRLPIIKSSSKLCASLGLCRPRSDRSCHRVEDRPRSSWELWSLAPRRSDPNGSILAGIILSVRCDH